MRIRQQVTAYTTFIVLVLSSVAALADNHPFTEGPVVNVFAIRTENGKFDEYLKFLETIWKPTQEASKKAGYITSYKVIRVEPRNENDPDIYLVTYYRNWAALDDWIVKADVVAKEVEGSVTEANKSTSNRDQIRRILGSWTGQELNLK